MMSTAVESEVNTHTILIVDDHPIVRVGIRKLIEMEDDLRVCAEEELLDDTLTAIAEHHPDLVLLDIFLKDSDGLDIAKTIRARGMTLPILVLSLHDEMLFAERALSAGANGYIMKSESSSRIVEAVRQVLRGDIYVSERVRQRILQKLAHDGPVRSSSPVETLSDRELEVYRMIGQGRGTREIADKMGLSIKTVETHRSHIKKKLCLSNATALVKSAVQWMQEEKAG
ncbi:MAG: response regulator transcription factor [Verrucomicrobia bacterium]|nr:response regulator transcription factor [Verrucomicrobiota bacterium]